MSGPLSEAIEQLRSRGDDDNTRRTGTTAAVNGVGQPAWAHLFLEFADALAASVDAEAHINLDVFIAALNTLAMRWEGTYGALARIAGEQLLATAVLLERWWTPVNAVVKSCSPFGESDWLSGVSGRVDERFAKSQELHFARQRLNLASTALNEVLRDAMQRANERFKKALSDVEGPPLNTVRAVFDEWLDYLEVAYEHLVLSEDHARRFGDYVNAYIDCLQAVRDLPAPLLDCLGIARKKHLDTLAPAAAPLSCALERIAVLEKEVLGLRAELSRKETGRREPSDRRTRPARGDTDARKSPLPRSAFNIAELKLDPPKT